MSEAGVTVVFGERLDLQQGVVKEGTEIVAIRMESGRLFRGQRFIDATYEGDLMALAGVSYHVGREASSVYEESLNGVRTDQAVHHQLQPGVDPYVTPGDPDQRAASRRFSRPAGGRWQRRSTGAGVLLPHVHDRLPREPDPLRKTRRL